MVNKHGRLEEDCVRSALAEKEIDEPGPAFSQLLETFTFIHYSDWLQGVIR